jgi:protein involved in polysaccharide export with SLBB domain
MRAVILALVLTLAGAGGLAAQAAPAGSVLRPGDAVQITVWRRADLSGEFAIAADGTIAHPILRQATVADLPLSEVESRIAALLRSFEGAADFVVTPLVRVGVAGEVRQPNLYLLTPDMTIANAVARAGGPTERGRLDRVTLLRGGQSQQLDLVDPSGDGARLTVQSGDQVLVSRRRDILREYVMPISSVVAAVAALIRVSQ